MRRQKSSILAIIESIRFLDENAWSMLRGVRPSRFGLLGTRLRGAVQDHLGQNAGIRLLDQHAGRMIGLCVCVGQTTGESASPPFFVYPLR